MGTRNPSPPPGFSEELQYADNIADTAYSKRWLFSLLLDLLTFMKSSDAGQVEELDQDLEERLCSLWDLTVNRDILSHLDEFDIVTILADVLVRPNCPRLVEISVGILANMAHSQEACHKMLDNDVFIDRVLTLFFSRDAPTLTEVCRLVQTVLSSNDSSSAWLTAIKVHPGFFDNLLFILRSSTSGHLLIAAIRLLDAITRGDDSFAEAWCGSDLLASILEAQHQMVWLHGSEVEVIHRLLYTFSSNVTGVGALIKAFDNLLPTFGVYLRKVCEDEPHLIPFSAYYSSLRAIIPVIDSVVGSVPDIDAVFCFSSDRSVLPCLVHITLGCQQQLRDFPLVRGVLADLNILFKDILRSLDALFRTITKSPEELIWLHDHTGWLFDLDRPPNAAQREAFINCLLNDGGAESRNHLLSVCNILKLPRVLESLPEICQ